MSQSSPLAGLRAEHVRLIARYWVRFSLRTGGGLMALLLVLVVGLSIAGMFVTPVESLMKASPELGHSEEEAMATVQRLAESNEIQDAAAWITGSDKAEAKYLLEEQPALISVILLIFVMLIPFIACVAGFNQTAGDIGTRGLRYLLLRTERPNIFFGRFLGTLGFATLSIGVVIVIMGLYVGLKFGVYGMGELTTWLGQGWIAAVMVAMPYLALCAWLSGVIDSPFGALAICLLLTGFPVILLKMTDFAIKGDQDWLQKLTPWGWKYELLSGDIGTRLMAYGAMLGFTALFLWLGVRHFAKRDL